MKIRNLLLITILTILFSSSCLAQIQYFEWQNVQRQYLVKTPENYESLPVLFFLHGLGDNITRLDNEFHFQQIADNFNWMIVVPQALNEGYGSMWNAGLTASTTNDSGFLMALLDSLAVQYPVNQDSVFFTGFSMGGFMSHRMAIEHGDRINAAAPVSGLITTYMAGHNAVAPVRILDIHGTSDPVVGYDGGSEYFGYQLGLSVESILNYWIKANGCTNEPVVDTLPDTQNDGLRFVEYVYPGTKELRHLKVIGGDHSWYHNANQHDIDYIDYIHNFFTGKLSYDKVDNPTTGSLNIYPNPTNGQIKIELNSPSDIEIVDIKGNTIIQKHFDAGMANLNLHGIDRGVYFVKTNDITEKIIVE
ncbi:MAG: T9SS type A sorting domain-containing protein [Bacteroidales bacterium]|nr:T9SS type A sorting domain-containing protein [Bacteroidales bacterium]